jgi:hypothetical protein
VSWICGLRLALRIQDGRISQDGAEELFKKQVCSGTTVFKHGSEALVPNSDSLLWNIHVGVGASHHLLGVDTQSAVAAEIRLNTVSDPPNAVPADDAKGLTCLADWADYKRLDGRRSFLLKYSHALALAPFVLALVICLGVLPRIAPDSAFWEGVAEIIIVISLGWALIFIVYALSVFTRCLSIRCPRCGWRFGLGDRCSSCDLPRSRDNPTPI